MGMVIWDCFCSGKESMNVSLEEIPQLRTRGSGDDKLRGWAYIKPWERNMVTEEAQTPNSLSPIGAHHRTATDQHASVLSCMLLLLAPETLTLSRTGWDRGREKAIHRKSLSVQRTKSLYIINKPENFLPFPFGRKQPSPFPLTELNFHRAPRFWLRPAITNNSKHSAFPTVFFLLCCLFSCPTFPPPPPASIQLPQFISNSYQEKQQF